VIAPKTQRLPLLLCNYPHVCPEPVLANDRVLQASFSTQHCVGRETDYTYLLREEESRVAAVIDVHHTLHAKNRTSLFEFSLAFIPSLSWYNHHL
jgi:hypothetical protein